MSQTWMAELRTKTKIGFLGGSSALLIEVLGEKETDFALLH